MEWNSQDPAAAYDCPSHTGANCLVSASDGDQVNFYALNPLGGRGKLVVSMKLAKPEYLTWSLSPDGSRIAMTSDQIRGKMRILDVPSGNSRDLDLPAAWNLWSYSWEADGKSLVLAAQTTQYFLARLALDGKTQVLLSKNMNNWVGDPFASPDGRHLAFVQNTWESNAWMLQDF